MKMTFSEFAKLLYNHIGNRCGADVFTYDLLTNILDPASNTILEELAAGHAAKILQWKKIDRSAGKTSAAVYRADLFFGLSGTKVQ